MNKRRLLFIALIIICIATSTVGTLAFFTAEDTARNTITSGSVKIELREWADPEKTHPFPSEGISGVMPNTTVTKIVEIRNTGDNSVWIRTKIDKNIELAENVQDQPDISLVDLDVSTGEWTEKDGWYYYNHPLEAGETTTPLFNNVHFDASMGNEYQDATATVNVTAQAVQTANNGETVMDALGWPIN